MSGTDEAFGPLPFQTSRVRLLPLIQWFQAITISERTTSMVSLLRVSA